MSGETPSIQELKETIESAWAQLMAGQSFYLPPNFRGGGPVPGCIDVIQACSSLLLARALTEWKAWPVAKAKEDKVE